MILKSYSVKFTCEYYSKLKHLVEATFTQRKCPIIEFPPDEYSSLSHVMVVTGILKTKEGYFVECKNSAREDPNTPPGKNMIIMSMMIRFIKYSISILTCIANSNFCNKTLATKPLTKLSWQTSKYTLSTLICISNLHFLFYWNVTSVGMLFYSPLLPIFDSI